MPQVWSSPVRFVECDQQGIVFNAHYLVWADEAVNTWWAARGVRLAASSTPAASSTSWSPARWSGARRPAAATPSTVDADLEKLGRTSLTVRFTVRVGERACCVVRTTYVCTAGRRRPSPWPDGDPRAGSA